MLRVLERMYRQAATGFAFLCLFGGGGLLAATVFPVVLLFPGTGREEVQRIIQQTFRFYIGMLQFLRLIRLEVVGDEQLRASRGALIVANHPSLLDVVLLMAQVPNAQCIVKHQLWNHPLLGGLVRRAGYIRNDLDGETMIDECRKSLQSGHNIIVFPEGTRSCPDGLQRLQRGFANIAILTGAKIQLVLITCTPSMLTKGAAWWMVPDRRSLFRLVVGRELNATAYLDSNNRSLASRRLTEHVETYYMEKLSHA